MLRNLPIRLKMVPLYLWMTICTMIIYFVSIAGFNRLLDTQKDNYNYGVKGSVIALEMNISLCQQGIFAREAMGAIGDEGAAKTKLDAINAEAKVFDGLYTELSKLSDENSLVKDFIAKVSDGVAQYRSAIDEFSASVQSGDAASAGSIASNVGKFSSSLRASIVEFSDANAIKAETDIADNQDIITGTTIFYAIFTVVYVFSVWLLCRNIVKYIAHPAKELEMAARNMANGDVGISIDYKSGDELGKLADQFREMITSFNEQAEVIAQIASGDYSARIDLRSEKDIVNNAISQMLENSNAMVADIARVSQNVSAGANMIAQGAQSLSSGSTEQSASVEEFSSTLKTVREKTQGTTSAANEALALTQKSREHMEAGIKSMDALREAMRGIDESARSISMINKVIDDIAFQTNILALNAAVEAARAGQYGRGFAVVAEEVRNLAAKSAEAAKETTALIEGSSQRVREGGELVDRTSVDISEVGELSMKINMLIEDIAGACEQQMSDMGALTESISQISHVVSINAASSEEAAAASSELNDQTRVLNAIISRIKLAEGTQLGGADYKALDSGDY